MCAHCLLHCALCFFSKWRQFLYHVRGGGWSSYLVIINWKYALSEKIKKLTNGEVLWCQKFLINVSHMMWVYSYIINEILFWTSDIFNDFRVAVRQNTASKEYGNYSINIANVIFDIRILLILMNLWIVTNIPVRSWNNI